LDVLFRVVPVQKRRTDPEQKKRIRLTQAAMLLLLRIGELLWVTGRYLPGGAKQSLGQTALRATQRVHHARPKRTPFL